MSEKQLPFYKVPGTEDGQAPTKYYLRAENGNDTEITEWQFNELTATTEQPVSGTVSKTDILRLHQEQDPASPLYKGPKPDENRGTEQTTGEQDNINGYYEPTDDKVTTAEAQQFSENTSQGTSVHTTEEATKANATASAPEPHFDHVVTEQTLQDNPDLADHGVQVGDTIQVPQNPQSNEGNA